MKILTLNCGSSSVKYLVYDWAERRPLAKGLVERIAIEGSIITQEVLGREPYKKKHVCANHQEAIKLVINTLVDPKTGIIKDLSLISAVGHRVVHGGEKFNKSTVINKEVIKGFEALQDLAPLHNPSNILGIKAAMALMPAVPHIAVTDTAFLQTLPKPAFTYAVPYDWYLKYRVRRYGFHGTSHLYVSRRAAVMLGKKPSEINLITCHIGNGVSFTAIKSGQAFDHSMGFTPLEGLVMGTRSGDLDPAIIAFISEKENMSAREVEGILNRKSGLLGLTGKYTDRRDVFQAAKAGDERAKLAFEVECYRIKKYLGAYSAALGKVDAVVFTAGAGEMAWELRERALEGLANIGIRLDPELNKKATSHNHEFTISRADSPVKVLVVPTDEELVFVEDVVAILEKRYDIPSKFTYSFEDPNYSNPIREEAYKRERSKTG